MQHVKKNATPRLYCLQSSKETADADVKTIFDQIAKHEYSIATGDTLRATLVSHDAHLHTLVMGYHNIVLDPASIGFIFADINLAYQSQPLPTDSPSYMDYARQQIRDLEAGRLNASIDYWNHLLNPIPEAMPLLPMAKVKTRQTRRSYGYHLIERELSAELVQRVTQISEAHGVRLMPFYLAVLRVALCRLLGIDDICIGVVSHGRDPTSKFGATVGHMANMLPLRFKGTWGENFPKVLQDTFEIVLNSLDNQKVPFAVISEQNKVEGSEGGIPLVQVAYDYRVGENFASSIGDCTVESGSAVYTTLQDLTLSVLDSPSDGHIFEIRCSDDFYNPAAAEFIADILFNTIESLVSNPSVRIKDVAIFSESQLHKAKTVAHGVDVSHSWPQSLPERFEQVVGSFPDSIAVKDGDRAVTYSQLKRLVGTYASVLLEANITIGSRVAVLCEPSIDLYGTMLAVFHIGAILIPLDVSVPASRRNDIMNAVQPDLLVFHTATAGTVIQHHDKHRSLNISETAQSQPQHEQYPKRAVSDPGSVSYILFTSGSTGVPKGIKLHQRGMMNYAAHTSKAYGLGQVTVLQQTSIGFDLAFGQIFNAFTNGGTLVVTPAEARGDPDVLSELILNENIEYTFCTPSEYSLLLSYAPDVLRRCHSWRFCHVAGEALPERLVEAIRELKLPRLMMTNAYGPAEAFVVTSQDIQVRKGYSSNADDYRPGSIGYVLPNTSVYIISEGHGDLLPLGMPGEICIAGGGVFNGYLDAGLDDGKRVKNPSASAEYLEQGFDTMYKSGDRGILHEDGSIEFLGRCVSDNTMIKLRGLRIDLREVTGAIIGAAPDDLADAAIVVCGDPQFLVCYVVFKARRHLEQHQLVALLQRLALPQYMIPSAIVPLERLPITHNGKLNTAVLEGLPLPTISPQAETKAEASGTEASLRAIWIDVIGTAAQMVHISPDSSFFSVGGNSLLLVQLIHAIHRKLGVKLHLRTLAEAANLRAMAASVDRQRERE
jgi:aspyridone synthetase (hybrid polyketide synthase/nonribosomal peptide synthetase)